MGQRLVRPCHRSAARDSSPKRTAYTCADLRMRFAVHKRVQKRLSRILPLVDLQRGVGSYRGPSIADACLARCRRILFRGVKIRFANSVLAFTATTSGGVGAANSVLPLVPLQMTRAEQASRMADSNARLSRSVFGQSFDALRWVDSYALRNSYSSGSAASETFAGQSFTVEVRDRTAEGKKGPYRMLFNKLVQELQRTVDYDGNATVQGGEGQGDGKEDGQGDERKARESVKGGKSGDSSGMEKGANSVSSSAGGGGGGQMLPLLFPVKNASAKEGDDIFNQDSFIATPKSRSARDMMLYRHFGRIVGCAVRSRIKLNLHLPPLFWKQLLGRGIGSDSSGGGGIDGTEAGFPRAADGDSNRSGGGEAKAAMDGADDFAAPSPMLSDSDWPPSSASSDYTYSSVTEADLFATDAVFIRAMDFLRNEIDDDAPNAAATFAENLPNFLLGAKVELSDGTMQRLDASRLQGIPDAPSITLRNRRAYANLWIRTRLQESATQMRAVRRGFAEIVPEVLLSCLLTWEDLEEMVCGSGRIDIPELQRHTRYSIYAGPEDPEVKLLWRVLNSLPDHDKVRFVQFVYANPRLPSGEEWSEGGGIFMKVSPPSGGAASLPFANTCFFHLIWPRYKDFASAKRGLTMAITCETMDADVH